MRKKIFFLISMIALFFSLTACQKEKAKEILGEEKGVAYYQQKKYRKALPLLKKSADSGNTAALYYLGLMHRQGNGVEKSAGKSCQYFLKAAEGGYKEAYLAAGMCYRTGNGFSRDDREAFRWARKAADETGESGMSDENRRELAVLLGDSYFSGNGTVQDFPKAAKWYEKAAELGDTHAQGALAFLYCSGKGVLIDREKAKYWADKAVLRKDDMGEYTLGRLSLLDEPPDVKKAVYWYRKASGQRNPWAQQALGEMYEEGKGVKRNLAKARYYYGLAAKSGIEETKKALAGFEERHKPKKAG